MLEKPVTWVLILFTTLAAFTTRAMLTHQDKLFEQSQDLPEILHLIDLAYVDEVKMDELMPHAFQGALEALDPNASFIPNGVAPTNYDLAVFERTGLALCRQDGYAYVMACVAGSPAAEAGLTRGVYIKQINNRKLRQLSYHAFQEVLARETGTITLKLINSGGEHEKEISFQPGPFPMPKLDYHLFADGIHHLKLPVFYPGFETDLSTRLSEITPGNSPILLDLRDNALGSEQDLNKLAGLFLKPGKLGFWVGSDQVPVPIASTGSGTFSDRNFYILINSGTARAAECFAAVAQEEGHQLVGYKSLGLGFEYHALKLSSGAHITLPARKFQLKSGLVLTHKGLVPDLENNDLEFKDGDDPVLDKALELLRKTSLKAAG